MIRDLTDNLLSGFLDTLDPVKIALADPTKAARLKFFMLQASANPLPVDKKQTYFALGITSGFRTLPPLPTDSDYELWADLYNTLINGSVSNYGSSGSIPANIPGVVNVPTRQQQSKASMLLPIAALALVGGGLFLFLKRKK
jgi:LPXTG-motif cell wall-anchored protein